jgi:purine-binding chemotaxis protein CheW
MKDDTVEQQFVVFELAGETYGLEIVRVQEIDRMQTITRVPQVPGYVEGIINLRGQVTPVVNLRSRLSLAKTEPTNLTRIVVVKAEEHWIGLIVDAVSQVLRIQATAVEPPPSILAAGQCGFVRGIAKLQNQLVTLLDLGHLLDLQEFSAAF